MNFFGKIFTGVEHAFAWIVKQALPVAETVAADAITVIQSPLGQAIARAFGGGGAVVVANNVSALMGSFLGAFSKSGQDLETWLAAAQTEGVKVLLDPVSVSAFKNIWTTFGKVGAIPAPAAIPTAQATTPTA